MDKKVKRGEKEKDMILLLFCKKKSSPSLKIKLFTNYCLLYRYELCSSSHKSSIFCFAQFLLQILDNYQNQGQIWNLLVLTFSKHPLHVQFDQVLAEIFEVKDT